MSQHSQGWSNSTVAVNASTAAIGAVGSVTNSGLLNPTANVSAASGVAGNT